MGDWGGVLEGAHEGPWAPREEVGILVMGVVLISAPHPNHHDLSGGFSCPPTHCEMLGEASECVYFRLQNERQTGVVGDWPQGDGLGGFCDNPGENRGASTRQAASASRTARQYCPPRPATVPPLVLRLPLACFPASVVTYHLPSQNSSSCLRWPLTGAASPKLPQALPPGHTGQRRGGMDEV